MYERALTAGALGIGIAACAGAAAAAGVAAAGGRAASTSAASTSARSEEHTSELQSPWNLLCRLLLEKKLWSRARPQPSGTRGGTAGSHARRPAERNRSLRQMPSPALAPPELR